MNREMALRVCDIVSGRGGASVYTVVNGPQTGESALFEESGATFFSNPQLADVFTGIHAQHPRHGQLSQAEGREIFHEEIVAAPRLCICGGGHVSLPVAELAHKLGFSITVIDEREEFANAARFPMADTVLCTDFETGLRQVGGGRNLYFVIVTRGHQYDRSCLEQILQGEYAYVGMIGSRGKVKKVFENMLEQGYTQAQIDSVHSPIGLPIGANTPDELAVSILAEIIQVRCAQGGDCGWDESLVEGLRQNNAQGAMCMIVSKHGSAPRSPGARMFVNEAGRIYGTVGGGAGENEAFQLAKAAILSGECNTYHCNMTGPDAAAEGMICGGVIDVFIQPMKD